VSIAMTKGRTHLLMQLSAVAAAVAALATVRGALSPAATIIVVGALALTASIAVAALCCLEQVTDAGESARRFKTELMSNVSHELRTPLNAILGYAEIMESMPEIAASERRQIVTRILSNAVTLTCAVNNLLEYSTMAAGAGELRSGTVRLAELFDEIEPWVGRLIDEKPIAFTWAAEPDLPPVETDRAKLRQVVLNLLANSAKFTPAGEIRLSAMRTAGYAGIEIAVSDTGVGMSASEQRRIFEDFRQLSGSTTRPFGGIGLGLTLVRRLCDLLGASIDVESTPSKGTRVAVRLPQPIALGSPLHMEALRASA
jgi:two-component system, cell cycle sensor histidine kinase PleC